MSGKTKTWYHVTMHKAWQEAGEPTIYRVNIDTKVSRSTIRNYISPEGIMLRTLPASVVDIATYFGVKWTDCVSEVAIEVDDKMPNPTTLTQAS